MRLCLALHEIIIERSAPITDEEARGEERGRRSSDFFDGRDRVGQRGCIDEDLLIEPVEWGLVGIGWAIWDESLLGLASSHVDWKAKQLCAVYTSTELQDGHNC